jgi:hypothetical protein
LRPHWRSDYQAETRKLLETVELITPASVDIHPLTEDTSPVSTDTGRSKTDHRAIVCFVEDNSHLIQQLLALRLSWLQTDSPDTDLVVIGPENVLMRLPDDLVKIAQQPAAADPVWGGYRYVNAIASLNGSGAEQLDRYSHILRTDVDTFITPAWNEFYPETFTVGIGSYATEEDVQQRIRDIATEYGLNHRGMTDVGASWYGPTAVVRRAAALAEMLTKHLLTHDFADDPGQWPGWYRGVAMKYASEIAVNHCAPGAKRSELLDASSTSDESITRYPHIHCVHTDKKFSKHAFMEGRYRRKHMKDLEMDIIKDYCLGLSMRSLEALTSVR